MKISKHLNFCVEIYKNGKVSAGLRFFFRSKNQAPKSLNIFCFTNPKLESKMQVDTDIRVFIKGTLSYLENFSYQFTDLVIFTLESSHPPTEPPDIPEQ